MTFTGQRGGSSQPKVSRLGWSRPTILPLACALYLRTEITFVELGTPVFCPQGPQEFASREIFPSI